MCSCKDDWTSRTKRCYSCESLYVISHFVSNFFLSLYDFCIQQISIFTNWLLFIVRHQDFDRWAAWFVLWVMEFSNKWVFEGLFCSESFLWVEFEEFSKQVNCFVWRFGEDVFHVLRWWGLNGVQHSCCKWRINCFYVFCAGTTCDLENSVQLVHCWCTWKEWLTNQQLSKNAPHCPHVHPLSVLRWSQKNLGSAVPSSGNIVSENWVLLSPRILENWSCQPKVTQLQVTLGIQQTIWWFQISVHQSTRMQILNRL